MKNINLELYKVFYYVASTKNITRASEILLISQPAITQTIKKLEDELDYKLFYRTSRGVELTNYGEELYSHIKKSIECLNNCKGMLDKFNNNDVKIIKIGGGTTLLKHNALEGFKVFNEKYPDVKIEIVRGITSELLEQLNNNTIDLVLFNMPIVLSENVDYKVIESVQDIFVAKSNLYKKFKDKKINISELSNLPLVLQSSVSSSRKFLNHIFKKNKIVLNDCYELESYDLVLEFVKAGLGIGFVNKKHVISELNSKELFEIKLNYEIPTREIAVAFNKKSINNKYIKKFIECINCNIKKS